MLGICPLECQWKLLIGSSYTLELAEKSQKQSSRKVYDAEVPRQCASLQRWLRRYWGKTRLGMLQRLGAEDVFGCRSQAQRNLSMLQESGTGWAAACATGAGHMESHAQCRSWALGKPFILLAKLCMLQEPSPGEDTCPAEVRHQESCIWCKTLTRKHEELGRKVFSSTNVFLESSTSKTFPVLDDE